MPYAIIEPSGCGIVKDVAKLRIDCFLEETDPNYWRHYVSVPDPKDSKFIAGYPGLVDAEGTPLDQKDYDDWLASIAHIMVNTPFHSHKIWLPVEPSDIYIKEQIERTLNYFYTFHQYCWDTDKKFIDEWKKVPKVKGSIRDVFVKGDPKDRVFNEQKVADILSRQAEFWIGVSRVPPTDLNIGEKGTIYVGSPAEDRGSFRYSGTTYILAENPALADGSLDTFGAWFNENATGVVVGTFYGSSPNFTPRDYETWGSVTAGSEQFLTNASCDVFIDDLAGVYWSGGELERDITGYAGYYSKINNQFGAGSQAYGFSSGKTISLYGTGTESGGGETYNETGHEQVILAVGGQASVQTMNEPRGQVILAVGGQSGKQTMTEARGQVIKAELGKADIQTMLEARGQVILAEQGHTDQAIFAETGHLQTVLASLAQTDLATFSELEHLETILAVIGESDLATFAETSHLQVIIAGQGESDLAIFSELGHLEEVLAILGETDTYIPVGGVVYDETGHLQAILFMSGESDNLRFTETGKVQAILVTTGESDTATFVDAHGQVILVKLGERTIRILKKIRRKSDIHNLGRMQPSYNLGTIQDRYTLGEGEKRNVIK